MLFRVDGDGDHTNAHKNYVFIENGEWRMAASIRGETSIDESMDGKMGNGNRVLFVAILMRFGNVVGLDSGDGSIGMGSLQHLQQQYFVKNKSIAAGTIIFQRKVCFSFSILLGAEDCVALTMERKKQRVIFRFRGIECDEMGCIWCTLYFSPINM